MTDIIANVRITDWIALRNPARVLKLDAIGLHTLPPLPPGLQYMNVSDNYLTSLEGLPESLLWIDATNNRLRTLPNTVPPHLESLYVSYNQIRVIPDMPPSLKLLSADHNPICQIGELPGFFILKIPHEAIRLLPPQLPPSALYVNHHLVWKSCRA